MAIDKTKPLTRLSWNEDIIQEINDLCENPFSGCSPLPPLEKVEEKHRWSKQDIQDAQDKLKEICPDNEFGEMPELWKKLTIDELEIAISLGWCNCDEE